MTLWEPSMPDAEEQGPIPDNTITLVPAGKVRCVVTGRLLPDIPEEHVRQRIARSLMDDYGYDRRDIEIEFTIHVGRSKKRVDIAIFPPDARSKHKPEHIKIIIECKSEDTKPTDRDNGIGQLHSYLAACLNALFGMWIGSELQVWEKTPSGEGGHLFVEATDIPRFGFDAPQPLTFAELVPARDGLIGTFKRCHNYIYGMQGMHKEAAC